MKKKTTVDIPSTWFDLQKQAIISFVDLHTDDSQEMMAYTQTFKPSKLQNAPFDVQHRIRSFDVWNYLNYYVNFIMAPEATCTGNVHYHGIVISIKPRKKRLWYNKVLPELKSLGFICLKPMKDLSKWISTYMLKSCQDFTHLKDNYLTSNYITKYEPRGNMSILDEDDSPRSNTYWKVVKVTAKTVYSEDEKKRLDDKK